VRLDMTDNSGRRLTRRPMETPGLETNSKSYYNYPQQPVYSQVDTPQSSQQFYYNDFSYSNSVPMDNATQRQPYIPSIYKQ